MKYLLLLGLVISFESLALVTSPVALAPNETLLEIKTIREGGKIEPNENKASFQTAKIEIYQVAVSRARSISHSLLDRIILSGSNIAILAAAKKNFMKRIAGKP